MLWNSQESWESIEVETVSLEMTEYKGVSCSGPCKNLVFWSTFAGHTSVSCFGEQVRIDARRQKKAQHLDF